MTSRDFAYWLQGFFEVSDAKTLNSKQTEIIKKHLALVFFHEIDPSYSNDEEVQAKMNVIHAGESEPVHMVEHHIPKTNPNDREQVIYRC